MWKLPSVGTYPIRQRVSMFRTSQLDTLQRHEWIQRSPSEITGIWRSGIQWKMGSTKSKDVVKKAQYWRETTFRHLYSTPWLPSPVNMHIMRSRILRSNTRSALAKAMDFFIHGALVRFFNVKPWPIASNSSNFTYAKKIASSMQFRWRYIHVCCFFSSNNKHTRLESGATIDRAIAGSFWDWNGASAIKGIFEGNLVYASHCTKLWMSNYSLGIFGEFENTHFLGRFTGAIGMCFVVHLIAAKPLQPRLPPNPWIAWVSNHLLKWVATCQRYYPSPKSREAYSAVEKPLGSEMFRVVQT